MDRQNTIETVADAKRGINDPRYWLWVRTVHAMILQGEKTYDREDVIRMFKKVKRGVKRKIKAPKDYADAGAIHNCIRSLSSENYRDQRPGWFATQQDKDTVYRNDPTRIWSLQNYLIERKHLGPIAYHGVLPMIDVEAIWEEVTGHKPTPEKSPKSNGRHPQAAAILRKLCHDQLDEARAWIDQTDDIDALARIASKEWYSG